MKTKQSPREILEKTDYKIYANNDVLENAPVGEIENMEWFTVGKYITRIELEKEYADRGLEPVNLNTIAAHCTEHQYVATIWDDNGPCCAAFSRWGDGRSVVVDRDDDEWSDDWWFAGRRKSSDLGTSGPSTQTLDSLSSRVAHIEGRIEALYEWAQKIIPPSV